MTAPPMFFIDLEDKVVSTELELEKAQYMMQDLTDDYFRQYSEDVEANARKICWDFKRAAVRAEILSDILSSVQNAVALIRQQYEQINCKEQEESK